MVQEDADAVGPVPPLGGPPDPGAPDRRPPGRRGPRRRARHCGRDHPRSRHPHPEGAGSGRRLPSRLLRSTPSARGSAKPSIARGGARSLTSPRRGRVVAPAPSPRPRAWRRVPPHPIVPAHDSSHAPPHDTRRRNRSGPLRVPGQAVLRPVRHPDVGRRRRRHGRRGGHPGRGRRLPGRGQGAGQGGRPWQGGGREVGRQRRRGPPARRQHPRARHQGPRGASDCGSSTPRTSPRSTTPASPWTGPTRCTWACSRPRAAWRSKRWRSPTPTPSPCCTSTPSTGSTRPSPASGWTGPTWIPRPGSRRPRCWSGSTAATSRAIATWPRSTR